MAELEITGLMDMPYIYKIMVSMKTDIFFVGCNERIMKHVMKHQQQIEIQPVR